MRVTTIGLHVLLTRLGIALLPVLVSGLNLQSPPRAPGDQPGEHDREPVRDKRLGTNCRPAVSRMGKHPRCSSLARSVWRALVPCGDGSPVAMDEETTFTFSLFVLIGT